MKQDQGIHLSFEIEGKPWGLWVTPELIEKADKIIAKNPEKYQYGKGLLMAFRDAKNELQSLEKA